MAPTNPPGGIAGTGIGFMQIKAHNAAHKKKGEESAGVIGMMDMLIKEVEKEITESTVEEKNSQEEYEQFMTDAATKRGEDSKAITEKEEAKAGAESDLTNAEDAKDGATDELMAAKEYHSQGHNECDWLLQNFDLRKTARAEDVDALKKAKAVLSGADFSLMQTKAALQKQ